MVCKMDNVKVQKKHNWIAYVGSFKFPEGSASSQRVLGVAKTIVLAGYDVVVGAGSESTGNGCFKEKQYTYGHKRVTYEITRDTPANSKSRSQKLNYLLSDGGKKTVNWLDEKNTLPKAVIYYGTNSSFIRRLKSWCQKKNIPLIVDVVEWYDPGHLGGNFSILNLENKFALKFLIPKCDGVIAISKLLESYYSKINPNVVRVPILDNLSDDFELKHVEWKKPYKLIYAGDSGGGKKDLLNVVIEEVATRPSEFQLDIYGISSKDLMSFDVFKENEQYIGSTNIIAHGKVSRNKVLEGLERSHFVPLLREDKKYAMAGFPTKMVEAMSMGIPLICNLTGDMENYIINSNTGLTVETPSEFGNALDLISGLNEKEFQTIKENARKMMQNLAPFKYAAPMASFLRKVGV